MSELLDRRLQVLVTEEMFARLEAESKSSGRSVGALVRGAIDLQWTKAAQVRRLAGLSFLEATADPGTEPEPDWSESKKAIADAFSLKFDSVPE